MGKLFLNDKIIDPLILSTDNTLIKAKGHVWHKSFMKKKVVPRYGLIQMQCEGIQSYKRLDIWIQITFDIKYWFKYCTFDRKFYYWKYTRQPNVQYIDSKKSTCCNNQKNIILVRRS